MWARRQGPGQMLKGGLYWTGIRTVMFPLVSLDSAVSKRSTHHICMQGLVAAALPGPDSASPGRWRCQRTGDSASDCNLTAVLVRWLKEL